MIHPTTSSTAAWPTFTGLVLSVAVLAPMATAGDEEGVVLKVGDELCTQGSVAQVQVRATTIGLVGGFGFNVNPEGFVGTTVRYDGPIFDTSWDGWDNAPADDVRVDAVCVFTEDQVGPGDHNLVTIEVPIPADVPAGTVIPVTLSNIQFFNYDFSIPSLDPRNGSILVLRTADLDGSGSVTAADLGLLIAQWGPAGPKATADFNVDGIVNGFDLGRLIERWGTTG